MHRMMWRQASTTLALATLSAALGTGLSAQDHINPYQTGMDAGYGRGLFERHCARCHGVGATGGETGPDLTRGQFRNASTDLGLFNVIQRGVPDTEMPAFRRANNDQEVWQLVTYLRSLTGGPRVEVPGDPVNGERLYRGEGECASCHMIDGVGGRHGPDLSTIGDRRSPQDLVEDLTRPDDRVPTAWWRMRIEHRDGTRVEGRRMNEGTYSVRILDDDDRLWSFRKVDLLESERFESSAMPSAADTFSEADLEDLVAYLYGLTRGGP